MTAGSLAQHIQELLTPALHACFETIGTIAVAAGPRLGSIFITATLPAVRILDANEVEILFPVRPLFLKRQSAEANFHPTHTTVVAQPGAFHVAQILVARHRAGAERTVLDHLQQRWFPAGLDASLHQVPHVIVFRFAAIILPLPFYRRVKQRNPATVLFATPPLG